MVAIAGRHTDHGRGLLGRNFDFFDWDLPLQRLYRTYPTQAPGHWSSLGCSDVPIGREDGVNEAGLAMAQTHVAGHIVQPGVLFSLVGRMVLDRCATVDEAVTLLESVPHVRANNWLLMDAHDQIAIVEASPHAVAVHYATDGVAMITNHFRTPRLIVRRKTPTSAQPTARSGCARWRPGGSDETGMCRRTAFAVC